MSYINIFLFLPLKVSQTNDKAACFYILFPCPQNEKHHQYISLFLKVKGFVLKKMTELNTIISQLSSTAQEGWRIAASHPDYVHGTTPLLCDPYRGRFCSACGIVGTLAYVIRKFGTSRPEPELVENMKNMVSKWKSERWYGWKVTRKTVDPMLQCFVELGRLYLPQNTH